MSTQSNQGGRQPTQQGNVAQDAPLRDSGQQGQDGQPGRMPERRDDAETDRTDRSGRNPGEPGFGADDETPQQGGM